MNDNDSRSTPADQRDRSSAGEDASPARPGESRREPVFTGFDDDYEESDRDTDYASAYEEEEDYLESTEDEDDRESEEEVDPAELSSAWQVLGREHPTAGPPGPRGAPEQESFEDEDEEYAADEDSGEDWDDPDDYPDEPDAYAEEPEPRASPRAHGWSPGLLIVGVVALALLAAGGYGVMKQRQADQQEIIRLQAALATAASPAEVADSREALREMEQQTEKHLATIEVLTLYNKRLTDTVAGLEQQLAAQQATAPGVTTAAVAATARPAAGKSATTQQGSGQARAADAANSSATGGDWFVNFSSYSQRGAAEKWAAKLQPIAGQAIVTSTDKDGQTLYRVRIVGLADRAQADKVAGQLQSAYQLPALWVGRE